MNQNTWALSIGRFTKISKERHENQKRKYTWRVLVPIRVQMTPANVVEHSEAGAETVVKVRA